MKSLIAQTLLTSVILFSVCLVTPVAADPCGEYPMLEETRLGFIPASDHHEQYTRVGDIVYASGYHSDFQVYDVSHATQPTLLADVDAAFFTHLGNPRFVVAGDLGFVDQCYKEIPIFDLADPAAPVEIARMSVPFDITALAVEGDLLFAVSFGRRTFEGPDSTAFHIYDVSDPTEPVVLTEIWNNHWAWAQGLQVRGGVAYLGATEGLQTFDVTDPANVVELDHIDVGWSLSNLQFVGDLLYATGGSTLHVIDVSDPANLVELGSVDTRAKSATSLSVLGDLAVTANGGNGLRVIDISDPAQPTVRSVWPSDSSCYGVTIEADRLCVLKADQLMIAARSFPDPIAPVGAVDLTWLTERAVLSDGLLYTAHAWELLIHDVSDPAAPVLLGQFEDGRAYTTLSLDGSVLFVAGSGTGGVKAIDVSDPTAPTELSQLTLEQASSVHAVNGQVAVGLRAGGVQLYDATDPAAPVLLGQLAVDPGNRTYGVHLAGDYLYTHARWTHVIDIGDPAAMEIVASHLSGWCYDIAADGPWIYTADGDLLKVLRFTPPATLEQVATQPIVGSVQDLHLVDNLLYAAGRQCGVHVFDVTDPSQAQRIGALPPDRESYGVAADTDHVAVINRNAYAGSQAAVQFWTAPCVLTGVDDAVRPPLSALRLDAAPNPFNPRVTFSFDVAQAGRAELAVFDLRGRLVATLTDGHLAAGPQQFRWNGLDAGGRPVASGNYLARLQVGGAAVSRQVMLVR